MKLTHIPKTLLALTILAACQSELSKPSLHDRLGELEGLQGKAEYLASPYVTAGNRVYVVGHQDGTFPDLGWHVTGEMGGIWDHPIKLMDGYRLSIGVNGGSIECLAPAEEFINYPFANRHVFTEQKGVKVSRMQFVPDGVEGAVIEYQLENVSEESLDLTINFEAYIDLRPVWLAERQNIKDGRDGYYYDLEKQLLIAKDSLNEWYVVIGSDRPVLEAKSQTACIYERAGLGAQGALVQGFELDPGERGTVRYFVAGSYTSKEAAMNSLAVLRDGSDDLFQRKLDRYTQLDQANALKSNNPELDRMYQWVRYNTDWLMREVPEQGRGLSAGLPDYPWWFGTDAGYAIEGLLAYGMPEEAIATIDVILKLSEDVNGESGQIMHEASTNGVVFNPGNLNTTPRFVEALWKTYQWTGADSLLQQYWPIVQQSIQWIEAKDHDGNGFADGPGMMEIPGLHTEMIDVVAYQELAYRAAVGFAGAVGDDSQKEAYMTKAEQLREKINSQWWSGTFGSFADFRATRQQAIELTNAAIVRADTIDKPWSVEELQGTLAEIRKSKNTGTQAYVVHHNWVVNTPMETGAADPEKALEALENAKKYRNRFGMFVTGIDRDEAQEKATQWKAFSYVGAVMTLPTGVQAIGSAQYGLVDDAYDYLKNLQNSFSYALPGSMYEVSPDFGMVVQAWNAYAVAVPIVEYYAGIKPDAPNKSYAIQPQLPSGLNSLRLSNVRIGPNEVTIQIDREGTGLLVQIEQTRPAWKVLVTPSGSFSYTADNAQVQGEQLALTGRNVELRWE